ncbi:MAG: cell division protein SepF [Oscillospiraceae bacterium]|jgi:cell division inhibitor SepF|nr:cell division protein SepF [Oscillospiraceae bacterium]
MANLMEKIKEMWTLPEDEYEEEIAKRDQKEKPKENKVYKKEKKSSSNESSKIVNIHTAAQLQVVLFKPERFGEETRSAADELIRMHTVVLNLENTAKEISRRILDFLSGVAYANNGKIKRIATNTFIITPYNVDLTGDDLLDELENNGVCL